MRIYSKFKDYYDTVRGYGIDNKVVYNRQTVTIEKELNVRTKSIVENTIEIAGEEFTFPEMSGLTLIFFCGELIPYHQRTFFRRENGKPIQRPGKSYIGQEVIDLLKKMDSNDTHNAVIWQHGDLITLFEQIMSIDYSHINTYYDTPVLAIRKSNSKKGRIGYNNLFEFIKNPILLDYNFNRVYNAFEVHQKISQFISNSLCASEKLSNISDSDMKVKKGFGHKYAFKKRPFK